ncbi:MULTISPECIES: glycoside hydrolase family 32 protein [Curtobacterium]|uniref:glycoside hydrolase family 32 protein n=1 Tax=Curtobacterium TaxID=2034 RepID=UPI0006FD952D|nr:MULTISPECIES: glycoside hydrolase family 32 protein [Curtobacterium]KQR34598.1 glycosyl hydrolase family 32 [Curtobacterium sp. Leaf154]MBT1618546.1 glycoside hydrolase family 32 protein [Curtobacterium flaccumfaciens pv. poinsettiae]MDD1385020.1 glycoside hydrolase family 32 protein [Curtobacterium flaccumfaciens pv. poinsettiae]TPG09073.1 glycoside hydrolase family 32 protein [Curtobacterium flaccumfaciens]
MTSEFRRRALLQGAGISALALFAATAPGEAARAASLSRPGAPSAASAVTGTSLRARYHMTPPAGWLSDPQRPVFTRGAYQLYYLHSDVDNGDGGWDHVSTTDGVDFTFEGTVIPLQTNLPTWTGCTLIDTDDTAGYGAGAVIALATRPTGGVRKYQEQYLFFSTDGGFTFTARPDPVIVNTDGRAATTDAEVSNAEWFRDPKVAWDAARSEWVCVIGRQRYAAFYTSKNLVDWTLQRNFDYPDHDLGGIECPDLFQITADDGTTHWVLAGSMDAYNVGLPCTYAYWTGSWDGTFFTADDLTPQWLDWGWDWYAAVTWPAVEAPDTKRYGIGWMNNWKYADRQVPTDASDGYNGQNSIVREITLRRRSAGGYALISEPVAALRSAATRTVPIADQSVNGSTVLPYDGRAYEIELDVTWSDATNVGVSVGRSADATRSTNIGKAGGDLYVDRARSDRAGFALSPYTRAAAPVDPATRSSHLRILVDTQSVEVFVDDGATVLSNQVNFDTGDTGISLFSDGGTATFSGITIREYGGE